MCKKWYTAIGYNGILGIPQTSELTILCLTIQPNCEFSTRLEKNYVKLTNAFFVIRCLRKEGGSQAEVDHLISSIVLPNITYALSVYGASESELTIGQQFLDRCFKRRYPSKKLEIGELSKVQDHRVCGKVFSITNHPLRTNFSEVKTAKDNLRKKSSGMPATNTDRFKNTFFFNTIVFKYKIVL